MNSKVYVWTSDAPIMIFHGRLRFFTRKLADSDTPIYFSLSNKQERMKVYINKIYLVFNRPNWLLAIENYNCNHLKLKAVTAQ